MGGFQKPQDSQILLHDIYAVFAAFGHFYNIAQMRMSLFEIN